MSLYKPFFPLVSALSLFFFPLLSVEPAKETTQVSEKKTLPPEEVVVTMHTATIQGVKIPYSAAAGTAYLKNSEGNVKGSIFYVAYTKENPESPSKRPITFCFNGGPGSSSVWLHMGAFGPKRVDFKEFSFGEPPYASIDNESSILDLTDLVFIDPISTGYSRPAPGEDAKQFHGLEEDIKWVSEFIRCFTTRYGRWESPKFLAGESYGTTRAAGMAQHLQEEFNMSLNGVILISSILDFQVHDKNDRQNDLPFISTLPSFTAAAWFHNKLPGKQEKSLKDVLKESETFAITEFASALIKGDLLGREERKKVVAKMSALTGLKPSYIEQNNLRINAQRFSKELLRPQNRILGRFDSRYLGIDIEPWGEYPEYDPSQNAIFAPFTAVFNNYIREDLNWKRDDEYKILTNVFPWNYGADNKYVNVAGILKQVISRNPACLIFAANGYYDLATPYFSQDYTFKHLDLDPAVQDNIFIRYYDAGHMMYTNEPSLLKLKEDLAAYYKKALS